MSIVSKIRGLWRFDGDVEPIRVSRRNFIFVGGVIAAAAMMPSAAMDTGTRYISYAMCGDGRVIAAWGMTRDDANRMADAVVARNPGARVFMCGSQRTFPVYGADGLPYGESGCLSVFDNARVAKQGYASVLGTDAEGFEGSSPSSRTR